MDLNLNGLDGLGGLGPGLGLCFWTRFGLLFVDSCGLYLGLSLDCACFFCRFCFLLTVKNV